MAPVLVLNDWEELRRIQFNSSAWLEDTYRDLMSKGTKSIKANFWLRAVSIEQEQFRSEQRRYR